MRKEGKLNKIRTTERQFLTSHTFFLQDLMKAEGWMIGNAFLSSKDAYQSSLLFIVLVYRILKALLRRSEAGFVRKVCNSAVL